MKFLKINDSKGYFLNPSNPEDGDWFEIDKIEKEQFLSLMNMAISNDFEMDPFSEELIKNKAHQIIYKNLYSKFENLLQSKSRFRDESEKIFSDALEKYKVESVDT